MVAPSIQNVAGYKELINYIDLNAATARLAIVTNTTGATIPKGSVVYLSGASGGTPTIAPAKSNHQTTLPAFGVLPDDIQDGATGNCQFSGVLDNVNTSAFMAGNLLFVSDLTAGVLTATEPPHPSMSQLAAIVTVKDASVGSMFIFPCFTPHGQEVGTISDTFKVGAATAGAKILAFVSSFIGSLSWTPTAARTLTLPDATDTLIGRDTTDTLTHKTYDSTGTGNVMKIGGSQVTTSTGSGSVLVLQQGPNLLAPDIGAATGTSLTLSGGAGKNGASPQSAAALGSAATDPATTMALVNLIRAALIADGTGS